MFHVYPELKELFMQLMIGNRKVWDAKVSVFTTFCAVNFVLRCTQWLVYRRKMNVILQKKCCF